LEGVHEAIERKYGTVQILPHDAEYVKPTELGNVFAVIEEYSYERYGMDAVVYWPRLIAVIAEDYRSQIADMKTTLDFLLNLSLLAGLFALGALGLAAWFLVLPELIYGLLALTVAYALYRLGIGAARELGNVIMGSFDLFRSALLEKYGLPKPASLIAERRLWLLLASYIRRGEEFYFPLEMATADDQALLQQELSRHTHNLYKLREQAAVYGAGATPLFLLNQIEDEEQTIDDIKAKMSTQN
jgi:hypothetical protein